MGTKELADLNAQRILEYNAMTPQERREHHKAKFSYGLRTRLTIEQKREKANAYQREYYMAKKRRMQNLRNSEPAAVD